MGTSLRFYFAVRLSKTCESIPCLLLDMDVILREEVHR